MPRLYPALIAVLLLGLLAASPASARVGHCLGGKAHSRCHIWTGKVTFVADGDTLDVRLGGRKYRIRMTGINAQELRVYSSQRSRRRGECHAIKATEDLIHMVHRSHNRVRLYAQNPHSHSGKRTRRAIGVKIGGHWVDAGARQIASGNALWLPNIVEQAWNREYSVLSQQAALTHRGMFNPRGCGRGPAANARLRLWVNWEAKGADEHNVNGEWVRIENLDPRHSVKVGHWVVRASDPQRYHLPRHARIPAGGKITVHVGRGHNHGNSFFWGNRAPVFNNVFPVHDDGDGGYLFDTKGNIRAFQIYPCRVACTDPLAGDLRISARFSGDREYVALRNVSYQPVDLDGHVLYTTAHAYPFSTNSVLRPGETVRVYMNGSPKRDTRLVKHWGLPGHSLKDGGDMAKLESTSGVVAGCTAWGAQSC